MTPAILHEIKRKGCELVLVQPDKKTFLVRPKTNDEILNKKIGLNAGKILQQLIDSDTLVSAMEQTANDDPKRWQQAWNRFFKDYRALPYAWDAYDHLISWLNANQRLTAARQKLQQLQGRKNKSHADTVSMKARHADTSVYQSIAVRQREKLVATLLSHADLYGQIVKYVDGYGAKKTASST